MSHRYHPLPSWLIRKPNRIWGVYSLQRWGLMRNHGIMPNFIQWISATSFANVQPNKTQSDVNSTEDTRVVTFCDIGCGEGLYLNYAAQSMDSKNIPYKVIGLDKNTDWIEFLSTNFSSNAQYHVLDMNKDLPLLLSTIAGCHRVACISTLQYAQQPLLALQSIVDALQPGAELFVYFPVDHHRYTPWYKALFKRGQNYESHSQRSTPVGLSAFQQFLTTNSQLKTLVFQRYYHALAAIGHEQLSSAQMVSRWTLGGKKHAGWSWPIRIFGYAMIPPAWLLAFLLYQIDKYFPLGSPNSVLWAVKK